jgi:5-formyltetrahydrofolate cyclo-ligase
MYIEMMHNDSFFEIIPYVIDEPVDGKKMCTGDIEMFIVPLLSFDKNSNRIGYDKEYYNRFLKQCSSNSSKIGLSYFDVVEYMEDINKA